MPINGASRSVILSSATAGTPRARERARGGYRPTGLYVAPCQPGASPPFGARALSTDFWAATGPGSEPPDPVLSP